MINPIEFESEPSTTIHLPRVLDGGTAGLDIERFAQTMAMLENYVDSLLAADGPPAMDPWIDDEDLTARIISL